MKQYCRYCAYANIVGDDLFYCQPKNEVYGIDKSKRINKCKAFDFNENDLWRQDEHGNFETYKPRDSYRKREQQDTMENYSIF